MNLAHAGVQEDSGIEVLGSMLAGLVQALRNVHVLSGEHGANLVKNIESNAWYSMAIFFRLLDDLDRFEVDTGPILFHAGACFARDWFENGNNHLVNCASDFLRMQGNSVGYSMAHRGDREKIGWLDLAEFDESAGYAKLVCVTPYPSEFERGLFHCGTYLAGDVDYVHIDTTEEPCSTYLSKKTHTIRFHKKADEAVNANLEALLLRLTPVSAIAIPEELQEPMAWRLKALEERYEQDQRFNEQSGLLLSNAASQVCMLSDRLHRLAHRDHLTDVLNRRAALENTQNILALAARNGLSVGFIMVDVDHFKSINDIWGHEAGDEALCSVAAILGDNIRDSDVLGRMGGEEFLIVLPETDLDGALVVAEKLRMAVQEQGLPSKYKADRPLTISAGVSATGAAPGARFLDCQDYIRQADHALYRSKQNGRNRVST
ncbi:hypothetical protein FGKAn22_22480 [Ferrigenium kumadai]|uniref:diguanylate cyclase n=2 Tax=Ferrigenium kumadai TaxID=1682490 RepID=A0AAN1T0M5_9PROT|nr:hypothetical protein FGKAn22_22480 [Ferrigenium kumadai]